MKYLFTAEVFVWKRTDLTETLLLLYWLLLDCLTLVLAVVATCHTAVGCWPGGGGPAGVSAGIGALVGSEHSGNLDKNS